MCSIFRWFEMRLKTVTYLIDWQLLGPSELSFSVENVYDFKMGTFDVHENSFGAPMTECKTKDLYIWFNKKALINMQSPLVEVEDIQVKRGETQVLWGASFEVGMDETCLIVGPNGHGKSTLLETIAGLHKPTNGAIRYKGERIDGLSPQEVVNKGITLVTEDLTLFPHMTVIQNLKTAAYRKGAWSKKDENLKTVFDLFPEIAERENQSVWSLSGGEKCMTSLGMGLMADSNVLMIDEPTFGLAPAIAKKVLRKVRDLQEESECIILVEENIEYMNTEYVDQVYSMKKGELSRKKVKA